MGSNWNEGMMRWAPYVDASGRAYPLNHLHPFRYQLNVGGANSIDIHVAFAMHCFTRAKADGDHPVQFYADQRETRSFCFSRYEQSVRLPTIVRELAIRKCGYAKDENYVTVDVQKADESHVTYGVFFNVRQLKKSEGEAVQLTVQSAYELAADGKLPSRGSIKFQRLVELTLAGIKPRPPRK